jgi:hypothetical protein
MVMCLHTLSLVLPCKKLHTHTHTQQNVRRLVSISILSQPPINYNPMQQGWDFIFPAPINITLSANPECHP